MLPSLVERELLVKFFYIYYCNDAAALCAFRTHKRKKIGKSNRHLSDNDLKTMIASFEKTASVKFHCGRSQKLAPQAIEEAATARVNRTQDNIAATS